MTQSNTNYIGLDIGKFRLDFYEPGLGMRTFDNTPEGIKKLISICRRVTNPSVVCEATSHYHMVPTQLLQRAKIPVSVTNPRYVRSFARAKGYLEKTDAIDAKVIAEFGSSMNPRPHQEISQESFELKALQTQLRQLTQMIVLEKTHCEGLPTFQTKTRSKAILGVLEQQKKEVESVIDTLIAADGDLSRMSRLLQTTPGVGAGTARLLISDLPELGRLSSRAISKLVGLAPLNNDSGCMRGKRSIHGGRKVVRNGIYMATLSAKKFNPVIKDFYDGLITRGKLPKVAMVACMRKLLILLNSMIKNGRDFYISPSLPLPAKAVQGCLSLEGETNQKGAIA